MRKFSRHMPPLEDPPDTLVPWFFLAVFVAVLLTVLVALPIPIGLFLSAIVLMQIVGTITHDRYLRRLAEERKGEDIGTFARAFNRHSEPFDPWVVRATWDILQPYVTFRGASVPLRPRDSLGDDLKIDPEDLLDLMKGVAKRSGHTLDGAEENPYPWPIETVNDFVRFITIQPFIDGSVVTSSIRTQPADRSAKGQSLRIPRISKWT